MLNRIGPMEIVLVLAVALLIFGPAKLPQLGKSVGESIREFKKSFKTGGDDEASKEESKEPDKKA